MPKHSLLFIIIALTVSVSIALGFSIAYLPQLQPESSSATTSRFDNETLFRSAAPFGHKLAVVPSYNGNEASIGVGNPSGYEFENCRVILETVAGEIVANSTLKVYDRILPHSYNYFTAQLEEGYNTDNVPDLLILECKEPHELATSPGVFIGKLDYKPGENVILKGMVGYSQVTLRVLDADGNTDLERNLSTNNGFLQSTFLIPGDAKPGTWSVQLESSSVTLGQDFRVTADDGKEDNERTAVIVDVGKSVSKLLPVNITQHIRLTEPVENLPIREMSTNWDGIASVGGNNYTMLDERGNAIPHTGYSDLVGYGVQATCTEPYFIKVEDTDATQRESDGIQVEKTSSPVTSNIFWGGILDVQFEEPQSSLIHYIQGGYGIFPADYRNFDGVPSRLLKDSSGEYHLAFVSLYSARVNLPEDATMISSLEVKCNIGKDFPYVQKSEFPQIYVYDVWFKLEQ